LYYSEILVVTSTLNDIIVCILDVFFSQECMVLCFNALKGSAKKFATLSYRYDFVNVRFLRCFSAIFAGCAFARLLTRFDSDVSDTMIGTLAVDGWAVTFGTAIEEGPGWAAAPPSRLLAVPNVTAPRGPPLHQRPVYQLIFFSM